MSNVPLLVPSVGDSPGGVTGGAPTPGWPSKTTPGTGRPLIGIEAAGWARMADAAQAQSSAARPPTRANFRSFNAKRTTALLSPQQETRLGLFVG